MIQPNDTLVISKDEINDALEDLKKNKAIGVDGLADFLLRDKERRSMLVDKLYPTFNQWINGKELPPYLKRTRVIALSKEQDNPYPKMGKIRTIAVAPALMKVYEKTLCKKLNKQIL